MFWIIAFFLSLVCFLFGMFSVSKVVATVGFLGMAVTSLAANRKQDVSIVKRWSDWFRGLLQEEQGRETVYLDGTKFRWGQNVLFILDSPDRVIGIVVGVNNKKKVVAVERKGRVYTRPFDEIVTI